MITAPAWGSLKLCTRAEAPPSSSSLTTSTHYHAPSHLQWLDLHIKTTSFSFWPWMNVCSCSLECTVSVKPGSYTVRDERGSTLSFPADVDTFRAAAGGLIIARRD